MILPDPFKNPCWLNCTAAPAEIHLEQNSDLHGMLFSFKKIDASANTVTLVAIETTLDGAADFVLTTQNETVCVQYDAIEGAWFILYHYTP